MQKAIFLDRDGVLIAERDGAYNFELKNSYLLPGIGLFLQEMAKQGYIFIVITNQSGVSKGLYTLENLEAMHQSISEQLKSFGVEIAEYYACPHFPAVSECLCRKPKGLLIQKAVARFGIDSKLSVMIGDRPRDIEAANVAGVRGLLIESNSVLKSI